MQNENQVVPVVKSVIGNTCTILITLVGVAFLAGIPLGIAAHQFFDSMFSPNTTVSPEK